MGTPTATAKIIRNSFWYGLETLLELVAFIATSIAVARALGPEKLGLYTSISYPILVLNSVAGIGLPSATRKYMAEFLATGRPGLARSVYAFTFRMQLIAAIAISGALTSAAVLFLPSGDRWFASILAVSVLPSMLSWMPAQANLAFEDASKNATSGMSYVLSYAATIGLTLYFHWDLPGIASASLIGRAVEATLRIAPLQRRVDELPTEALPAELKGRIRRFCLQALGVQVLTSVVWNRSELLFLTALSDMKQVAYYSVSSGVADKLLIGPTVFATATGISLMTESSRDARRVNSIVGNSCRFLSFIAMPVSLGAAAIAAQTLTVAYGPKYLAAIPVMAIASALAIPRAFQNVPDTLLRAADRQSALLRAMVITGILNVLVDVPLIVRYGAVGAAIGNGVAQTIGILLLWRVARQAYHFDWPFAAVFRFGAAAVVMAAAAWLAARPFAPAAGMMVGIAVGAPLYLAAVRVFRAFEPEDLARLSQITDRLPALLRAPGLAVVRFAVGGGAPEKPATAQAFSNSL